MARSRVMRGVLGGFLGTFTSRYTDFRGYWLFGFLVDDLEEIQIDLLSPEVTRAGTPLAVASDVAFSKFQKLAAQAGVASSRIVSARLTLRRLPGDIEGHVNGRLGQGHRVSFVAEAVMSSGRHYEKQLVVFVAPHNPENELKSGRAA